MQQGDAVQHHGGVTVVGEPLIAECLKPADVTGDAVPAAWDPAVLTSAAVQRAVSSRADTSTAPGQSGRQQRDQGDAHLHRWHAQRITCHRLNELIAAAHSGQPALAPHHFSRAVAARTVTVTPTLTPGHVEGDRPRPSAHAKPLPIWQEAPLSHANRSPSYPPPRSP